MSVPEVFDDGNFPLECLKSVAAADAVAAETLQFTAARCQAILSVLTSVLWVSDAEGRFCAEQTSWGRYTGQSWQQQQGFGWLDAVHAEDRNAVRSGMERARRDRTSYFAVGRVWNAARQEYRRCEARAAPVEDQGEIVEWVGTCKDVEDQRRAAEHQQRAEQSLRDADRRKDEFNAVLAHELRNPLAPIRNAAHILKQRSNADMQLTWARSIIERQVAQMSRLLEDLLDVSRIGQNKLELDVSRVTLDSVLECALEVSRPQIESHGHQFEMNILTAGPLYVEADPPRLAQALCNLLNNAAKYTDSGGRISLTVRTDEERAIISVKDSGIGISPAMLPRVFEMFCQDAPALERAQGGLGIGLSLVHSLVTMHGGTVEARSEGLGRGSEFVVKLPLARTRFTPAPPNAIERESARLKILVADDNKDVSETLAVMLEMMGHQVETALDGEQAVAIAAALRPDVVVLDIGMPKKNGYDAAMEIREELPSAMLIAATGWGQREDLRRAALAGFDHHLTKPVDPERLSQLLSQCAL